MVSRNRLSAGAKVVVLGLAFKENCPDLRNSKVVDVIRELQSFGIEVLVHDPRVEPHEAMEEYGIELTPWEKLPRADALVLAVAHREFAAMPLEELAARVVPAGCVVDVKSALDRAALQKMGFEVWRL
jgi:UDP-N-acetyl-D-galactosamine dehydrogenase